MDKGKGVVVVAPAPAPAAAAGKKAKRFDIKKWNAVSLWAWGACASPHGSRPLCLFLIIFSLEFVV